MKAMKAIAGMVMAALVTMAAQAGTLYPLDAVSGAGLGGATHVLVIRYDDADIQAETNDNTALTIAGISVDAPQGVELIASQLVQAFDGTSWDTNSVAMTVGDGTDADLFLQSQELASDGTEVFLKFGRRPDATISTAVTKDTTTITYLTGLSTTGSTAVVTNTYVSATGAAADMGRKVYTSDDTVDVVLTPSATRSLADNTAGEVRLYFRIWDAR